MSELWQAKRSALFGGAIVGSKPDSSETGQGGWDFVGIELDHVFICTDLGAPEAELLIAAGFDEGPSNSHPGQGTANRRFFFLNGLLELLWVRDAAEAQSDPANRTQLWERWSQRRKGASPFGVAVRPTVSGSVHPAFRSWEYRPAFFTEAVHVATIDVREPMWFYLSFATRPEPGRGRWPVISHANSATTITGVKVVSPAAMRSDASRALTDAGVIEVEHGPAHLLELVFDSGRREQTYDFTPALPLICRL